MVKVCVKEAVPLAPALDVALAGVTVAVPIEVPPSLKVTVPVGPWVLKACELMATDTVTAWFVGTGLGLAVREEDVVAGVTVTMSVAALPGAL